MGANAAKMCAKCHEQGRGCCTLGPSGRAEMFPITWSEVTGICNATGLAADEFVVADHPPKDFMDMALSLHPVFDECMPGGVRLRLRIESGSCCLLGPAGCGLPSGVRPLYCRLYPFFFTPDDRLMVLGSDRCLAQEGARSWREVLMRLDGNELHLRELFALYKSAATAHHSDPGPLAGD